MLVNSPAELWVELSSSPLPNVSWTLKPLEAALSLCFRSSPSIFHVADSLPAFTSVLLNTAGLKGQRTWAPLRDETIGLNIWGKSWHWPVSCHILFSLQTWFRGNLRAVTEKLWRNFLSCFGCLKGRIKNVFPRRFIFALKAGRGVGDGPPLVAAPRSGDHLSRLNFSVRPRLVVDLQLTVAQEERPLLWHGPEPDRGALWCDGAPQGLAGVTCWGILQGGNRF